MDDDTMENFGSLSVWYSDAWLLPEIFCQGDSGQCDAMKGRACTEFKKTCTKEIAQEFGEQAPGGVSKFRAEAGVYGEDKADEAGPERENP